MKFANLKIDSTAVVCLVDTDAGTYWPVTDLVPGFSGDMVQLVQEYPNLKSKLEAKGEGKPLNGATVMAPITEPFLSITAIAGS